MSPRWPRGTFELFLLAALAGLTLCGCENSIQPYSRRAEPYSVYGALSLHDERQFVRVKPLQTPFRFGTTDPLPADVTVKDLATGATYALKDSIIEYEDGIPTHNFWTDLDVKPHTEYKLTVEGPDGRVTEGITKTPTKTVASIVPDKHTPGAPRDTIERGSDDLTCFSRFRVEFRDAHLPWSASVGLQYKDEEFWVPYDVVIREGPNGYDEFNFTVGSTLQQIDPGDYDNPQTCLYRENQCRFLNSGRIRVAYDYLGPNWFGSVPPDSVRRGFDPTSAGQLDNGLGFFGSFERDTISVTINRGIIELSPFACKLP